jgi:putative transposase
MDESPTPDRFGYRSFYRRNLPHIQPVGADLFVTFRLADSLPQKVLAWMAEERRWREEIQSRINKPSQHVTSLARRHFAVLEKYLDNFTTGPTWLAEPPVADLVTEALHHRDGRVYRLDAFSIMPNHVHSVFMPLMRDENPYSLSSIMHSLKRHTAQQANQVLGRSGMFWAHESFDHYIRDGAERRRIIEYVLQNPVKAGLVERWEDWRWNYVRTELLV